MLRDEITGLDGINYFGSNFLCVEFNCFLNNFLRRAASADIYSRESVSSLPLSSLLRHAVAHHIAISNVLYKCRAFN
jgi:hypothetical protein